MVIDMEITMLQVYGDSKLIINQRLTKYEVRKDDFILYFRLATQLLRKFEVVMLEHVPRKENQMADTLANLASSMALGESEDVDRQSLNNYLEHGKLLDDPRHRFEIREDEVNQAIEEAHSGVCGTHQSEPKLHFQLKRMGYYWPSMSFARKAYILAITDYFSK
ncbi:hypothetical protein ACFX10_027552 [Malus domestica]